MAKNVVSGDGYFTIGEYSFPKGSMFLQYGDEEVQIQAVAGSAKFTFRFKDLRNNLGAAFADNAAAVTALNAAMFLPEVELILPA